MAGEAIRHLERVGVLPSRKQRQKHPIKVTPEILMEVAAILRIIAWQEAGLLDLFLEEDVDSVFDVISSSESRLVADPKAFAKLEGLPPLMDKVFDLWSTRFAWSGLDELSADVLLDFSESDVERLFNTLADFLLKSEHGANQCGS